MSHDDAGYSPHEEFVISRTVNAPRELVWKAHTEPERLAQWWGPKGFIFLSCTVDLRPGGVFHYGMAAPDGTEMWGKFVYREIKEPERLVYVLSFSDAEGGTARHPLATGWPLEMLNTILLTEDGEKTTVTIKGGPLNATESERRTYVEGHGSMHQGFTGTYDQLEAYLVHEREGLSS
ncbi:MAG: SRPBCC domain-containing protein [Candidatus Hydrogenedentes bacterium]|nr:SRPBCC domain-containing protein [Candidatus Hydrogenedentota bacterium]